MDIGSLNFSEKVFFKLKQVPKGFVVSYGELAKAVGSISGSRAVGNVLNKNQELITIPCHRVVCSDGKVGGYVLGVDKKIELLESEGVVVSNGKIVDFEKKCFKFEDY